MPVEITEYEDVPEWMRQHLRSGASPRPTAGSGASAEDDEAQARAE